MQESHGKCLGHARALDHNIIAPHAVKILNDLPLFLQQKHPGISCNLLLSSLFSFILSPGEIDGKISICLQRFTSGLLWYGSL